MALIAKVKLCQFQKDNSSTEDSLVIQGTIYLKYKSRAGIDKFKTKFLAFGYTAEEVKKSGEGIYLIKGVVNLYKQNDNPNPVQIIRLESVNFLNSLNQKVSEKSEFKGQVQVDDELPTKQPEFKNELQRVTDNGITLAQQQESKEEIPFLRPVYSYTSWGHELCDSWELAVNNYWEGTKLLSD